MKIHRMKFTLYIAVLWEMNSTTSEFKCDVILWKVIVEVGGTLSLSVSEFPLIVSPVEGGAFKYR